MLTWRAVDLEADTIALTTQKTGWRVILPLAKSLRAYLVDLEAPNNPDALLFPIAAKIKHVGHLSNSFRDLLADTGLVKSKTSHVGVGKAGEASASCRKSVPAHEMQVMPDSPEHVAGNYVGTLAKTSSMRETGAGGINAVV